MPIFDTETLMDAIDLQMKHPYSFWDCMIIGTAIRGGATVLFSEDLKHGHTIEGVTIDNPFI